jgi:hypothetical protein
MSAAKMMRRAETMVLWFEAQTDFATLKTDAEIAGALHRIAPGDGWVHAGALNGNVALVRQVRRWVDRQTVGDFADYVFGIRRTGGGRNWVHLRTRQSRITSAEIGTVGEIAAGEMMERRLAEERGRIALKFNAEAEEWFQLGDFQRSMACRDSANDYEQVGYLRPTTKATLQRLGLA